ncbi:peptide-methionine (R)-S-oxide reductase MsrB [Cesiribacter sp. SM1]|uniref:peptide-methionine (R)-S-oxide reductase MsrB n=1 Tax=Cesiribacter sp. SM1 TaxID=2861196 RepID=UPI001CD3507F|nr:peptide-methionine (R)-S-oxide reductase MsrB [Cesiribacter sp. SM1]
MAQSKLLLLLAMLMISTLGSCQSGSKNEKPKAKASMTYNINKSEAEWRKALTPEQFKVLRQKGTERAFSGKYNKHKEEGVYTCAACGQELFSSKTKFDSGTGWPSYFKPISKEAVAEITDTEYGMVRTEVVCSNCGGHLGHVFNDGPKPTGLRYCLNSVSLGFVEKEQ